MIVTMETRKPADRQFTRVDTMGIKSQIERKIGGPKAKKYFYILTRFLSLKISKSEFQRLCIATIGQANIHLHNCLLRSIMKNAYFSNTHSPKEARMEDSLCMKSWNGHQKNNILSLCHDISQAPRKGRTSNLRDRKFMDRPSPLGPYGKSHKVVTFEDTVPKVQEQQSASELLSLGSRPPGSVEDGEEVDQASGSPGVHSWSPVQAPLGIPINIKGACKVFSKGSLSASNVETCHFIGELPDTCHLMKRLEQKLEKEGLKVSMDCVNLLNNGLDAFLRRLIKPCLNIAASRSKNKEIDPRHISSGCGFNRMQPMTYTENPWMPITASMLDFLFAMELNPQILGEDWPSELEKICLRSMEP